MPVIKRQVVRDMPDRARIVAHFELRVAEGDVHLVGGFSPGFSATCEIYEARSNASGATRQRLGREPTTSGAARNEIRRAFPHLALLVDLHLSDPDGVPMHAEANGWYWYSSYDGRGTHEHGDRSDYEIACKLLRVESIPSPQNRASFARFVDAQRERWAEEARAGRALLESLPAGTI